MREERRPVIKYSMAFKQKVVSEIEYGRITVGDAERIYGINGHGTIDKWLKKFGKNHLLAKVVRIEMKDEKDRVRELEKEKRVLETALGQSQLKIMMLERYVEIAKDKYGIDLKKKNGTDVLDGVSRRSKKLA